MILAAPPTQQAYDILTQLRTLLVKEEFVFVVSTYGVDNSEEIHHICRSLGRAMERGNALVDKRLSEGLWAVVELIVNPFEGRDQKPRDVNMTDVYIYSRLLE